MVQGGKPRMTKVVSGLALWTGLKGSHSIGNDRSVTSVVVQKSCVKGEDSRSSLTGIPIVITRQVGIDQFDSTVLTDDPARVTSEKALLRIRTQVRFCRAGQPPTNPWSLTINFKSTKEGKKLVGQGRRAWVSGLDSETIENRQGIR